MGKKYFRYFFGFLDTQEKWLNSMAEKGLRLVKAGKFLYEFEECVPDKYQYKVDFVGDKSSGESKRYLDFLQEFGYRVMTKNMNLNLSVGKVKVRPYGKGAGKIAANPGTYNKELFIVEKVKDGRPFEIHTVKADKMDYCKRQRNVWLSAALLLAGIFLLNWISKGELLYAVLAAAVPFLLPAAVFQKKIMGYLKEMAAEE